MFLQGFLLCWTQDGIYLWNELLMVVLWILIWLGRCLFLRQSMLWILLLWRSVRWLCLVRKTFQSFLLLVFYLIRISRLDIWKSSNLRIMLWLLLLNRIWTETLLTQCQRFAALFLVRLLLLLPLELVGQLVALSVVLEVLCKDRMIQGILRLSSIINRILRCIGISYERTYFLQKLCFWWILLFFLFFSF